MTQKNTNEKIERQYKKWSELLLAASNEADEKKADKAFNKLQSLFACKDEFDAFYKSKIGYNLYQTKIN